jgi:hypothetical protein
MPTYRVYYLDKDGIKRQKDYKNQEALTAEYEQVGVEEDSYTIRLHGEPLLRGLIGPLSEGKTIVKYETKEVFIRETEEWSKMRRPAKE